MAAPLPPASGPPTSSVPAKPLLVQPISLDGITLKKVETKGDISAPVQLLCSDSDSYLKLMKETYFEQYWDQIKSYSFASELIPCPVALAKAICEEHINWNSKKEKLSWKSGPNGVILLELASDIDKVKEQRNFPALFVRLSSRSAKDAALTRSNFRQILEEDLRKVQESEKDFPTPLLNQKFHALYKASTTALKVDKGEEGIQLLIESDRIQGDLETVIAENDQTFNIVVREWGKFEVELEFRAFVYKKKFTGLTQYNHLVFFPKIIQRKEQIARVLARFIENEIIKLPLENLVIDFAMAYPEAGHTDGPYEGYTIYVVEINPLAEFAGTGMFTWEKDRATLLGQAPFEFRTADKVPDDPTKEVSSDWLPFLQD